MAETIRRLLFIVESTRPEFYESLRRTFRGDDTVQVVLDRRRGDRRGSRRSGGRKTVREQRGGERRAHLEIERQLRSRGYAVVGVVASRESHPGNRIALKNRPARRVNSD